MLKLLYNPDLKHTPERKASSRVNKLGQSKRAKKLLEYDYINKRGHLEDEFFVWSGEEVDALVHRLTTTIGSEAGCDIIDPDIED